MNDRKTDFKWKERKKKMEGERKKEKKEKMGWKKERKVGTYVLWERKTERKKEREKEREEIMKNPWIKYQERSGSPIKVSNRTKRANKWLMINCDCYIAILETI